MLNIPLDKIIEKIRKATKVSEKLIKDKIAAKKKELNGLVSDEGAAYIIASEMNVDILGDISRKKLKIKDVLVGMRSVTVTGRVLQKFDVKDFKTKDGREGKVGAFMLGDETGKVRIVVWTEQIQAIEKLERGMAIKISGAYSRENRYTGIELHLGNRSKLEEVKDSDLPPVDKLSAVTVKLEDARPSDDTQARGLVVQAYRPNFYDVCSECGKSVKAGPCTNHKDAKPKKQMLLSFMLDDGEKCVRCVAFREVAEKLTSLTTEAAQKVIVDKSEAALTDHVEELLLGKVIQVSGRMRHNEAYNRSEITVNSCELELDPSVVIKELTNH